ncbi:MAG TPA: hypothetical protein PLA68_01510 [Panacibacter sp.]|nr:hypothetical protein [Panacibacter sp.]
MKTKIFTLLALAAIVLSAQNANATIRRVGYFGTPRTGTDYSDLTSAHAASAAGDTILLYPGTWDATFSKKIVLIGYGYYTDQNANLQVITGTSTVNVTLATGSDNSIFTGVGGLTLSVNNNATIAGITVNRCIAYILLNNKTYTNWQVTQSMVGLDGQSYNASMINWLVSNCIVGNTSVGGAFSMATNSSQSCLFTNNVCQAYSVDFGNANVVCQNTIFLSFRNNAVAASYQNCIQYDIYGTLPAGNGNQNLNGTTINNLFVGYPTQGINSTDGRWVLKAGSAAIGTGIGGVDCGIYGGAMPYRLSGIPAIPAFYKLTAPSTTTSTNPYTITFSVRSNN